MITKLAKQIERRFAELEGDMADPAVIASYLGTDPTAIHRSNSSTPT